MQKAGTVREREGEYSVICVDQIETLKSSSRNYQSGHCVGRERRGRF